MGSEIFQLRRRADTKSRQIEIHPSEARGDAARVLEDGGQAHLRPLGGEEVRHHRLRCSPTSNYGNGSTNPIQMM